MILPALNRPPRHADNELVLWQEVMVDNHLHLIAAPFTPKSANKKNDAPNIYEYLKALEKERADNETVRLLYVATTRTQRQLHLIASMQSNKNGEIKPVANSLLKVLWPAIEADFKRAELLELNDSALQVMDIRQFKPQLQRLYSTEFTHNFLDISDLNIAKTSSDIAGRFIAGRSAESKNITNTANINSVAVSNIAASFDLQNNFDLYRHCGILAHIYMQLFSTTDLHVWHGERLQQCEIGMQKWLMQQGHAAKNAQQGAVNVLVALQTTLQSEAGQWVLKAHDSAASELSLMRVQEHEVNNHVIDRTFIENGTRWIVDYKLTATDETLDFNLYAEQHRPQLERYASLFISEELPIKKAVLFLSSGKLVEL